MTRLTLEVKLETPSLIGSGTGYGSLIDTDIVFDEYGIPYIPAKRIKGCLRDSAIELCEYFEQANVNLFDLSKEGEDFNIVIKTFGKAGSDRPAGVYFNNLFINEYDEATKWLSYLMNRNKIICRDSVIDYFTEIRQQTAIDKENGVAKEHSLRTIRVIKGGFTFGGNIDLREDDPEIIKLLCYAAKNLKHLGTKRTRGFGFVECKLFEDNKELDFLNELEELCRQ